MIFTMYMTVAAHKTSKVVFGVFMLLWPTFLLLVVGALAPSPNCTKAGGWMGILCACTAWYGSAAVVINTTWQRTVFPGVYVHEKVKVDEPIKKDSMMLESAAANV